MTITYPDGNIVEALLLLRGNETLRAAAPAYDDVLTFTRMGGTWKSEAGEPVKIQFAWERRVNALTPIETECVCSKMLASRLLQLLALCSAGPEWIDGMEYVFSAAGDRVRIQQTGMAMAWLPDLEAGRGDSRRSN